MIDRQTTNNEPRMAQHQRQVFPIRKPPLGWALFVRATLRTWLSLGAICVSLAAATIAVGEDVELTQAFDGVRRDTDLPEVWEDIVNAFGAENESEPRPMAQSGAAPLQQPGGIRRADAADAPVVRRSNDDGEALPTPRLEGRVPISGWNSGGDVDVVQEANGNVSMVVRDASLSRVLSMVAQIYGLNIVASNDIDAIISITLHDVPLKRALTAILSVANYTWVERHGIILITSLSDSAQLPADVQGRRVQVFDLDFASASTVADAVTGLLSPIGKLSVSESDAEDNSKTREMIVVEDLHESLVRIASYIHEVDQPPRQVLLEAHILEVTLKDTDRHGVNLNALLRAAGSTIRLETTGFANPASSPAFLATVQGGDLTSVVEILQSTTDTKTLGSPKLLVLNQQEAMIHVGEDIGYQGSQTTTETSTFQNVQFLQVGVVLRLTPRITRDSRVLLHVKPEVSTGAINPTTSIPDKKTTELETDVMLNDGQGMVIGGLIKETDSTIQTKIPYLGDLWRVGNMFKRSEVTKERAEIIVAIVPRVQPYGPVLQEFQQGELARAQTSLFGGALCRTERSWEPVLPDGKRVVRPLIPAPPILPQVDPHCTCVTPTPHYHVPPRPAMEQRFGDDAADPWNTLSSPSRRSGPAVGDGFTSEFAGEFTSDGAVISDRP